jgi:hypothetical protein
VASFNRLWGDALNAWEDDKSYESPGARFGLLFDPTAYALDIFGKGDKYRDLVIKSGDEMNRTLSSALGTDDRNGWAANKPASTLGLAAAAYYTGAGLLGGGGGGAGAGGGSGAGTGFGSDLGFFSNGGQAGLEGLGGGNAGLLAANNGIAGGAGMGASTAPGSLGMEDYLKLGQGGGQGQQQQQQQPMVAPMPGAAPSRNVLLAQLARMQRAQQLRRRVRRTPEETAELRELTRSSLLG